MPDVPSPVHPDGAPVDLRPRRPARSRGLELTPDEQAARRRNRRWLLLIAVPSVIVLVLALVASGIAASKSPSGPAPAVPSGYRAVNDGYFSYVVPASWSINPAFTDSTGDVDNSGPSGWAGEHIGYRLSAPVLGEPRPASLAAFGMDRPTPYQLTNGHQVVVKGAATAYAYQVIRPGGFTATAIDAWDSRADVELWLMIEAPPAETAQILDHLQA